MKRFWLFFRRMRRESCGSADTQEAIRRVNPSQSALGNSITKECRALASTVARTLWSLIPVFPLCVLSCTPSDIRELFGKNGPLPVEERVAKGVQLSEGLLGVDH